MLFVAALCLASPTPAQKLLDLHASAADFLLQHRGKVLVLLFVRTDCPISNRYAPLIQQMSRDHLHGASFQLVFPDSHEPPEKIRGFLRDFHYRLPAVRDLDHDLTRTSSIKVTPEAAVFDPHGQLIYHGRIDNLYQRIGQSRRAAATHELADAIAAASRGEKPPVASADAVGCFISDLQ